MRIAEAVFGVSNEEYWKLYKEWAAEDDRMDKRIRDSWHLRETWEKEHHGHESIWPRLAWIFDRTSLKEVKR